MARLFGFIGNRPDLGPSVLEVDPAALRVQAGSERLGWGLGFYQGGEVLLRRRPLDERKEIDIAQLTSEVRTDILLGTVRPAGQEEPRTENTQPFRFRQWLFVQSGSIARFSTLRDRLLASIPDFLRRNVRGDTDSELVFQLYLSFLHDAGKLDSLPPKPLVTEALRSTLMLLDRLSAEEGAENAGPCSLLVSNGEFIAGLNRGAGMAWRPVRGENDIDVLLPDDGFRKRRMPDLARVRFTILADGLDQVRPSWTRLPDRSTVVLGHLDDPVVEQF